LFVDRVEVREFPLQRIEEAGWLGHRQEAEQCVFGGTTTHDCGGFQIWDCAWI
jgi:hypothetical protein